MHFLEFPHRRKENSREECWVDLREIGQWARVWLNYRHKKSQNVTDEIIVTHTCSTIAEHHLWATRKGDTLIHTVSTVHTYTKPNTYIYYFHTMHIIAPDERNGSHVESWKCVDVRTDTALIAGIYFDAILLVFVSQNTQLKKSYTPWIL